LFVSSKLKEDVKTREDKYLARERVINGGDLIQISNFFAVGLNPMNFLSCIFSCFQNRTRDVFFSVRIEY
jgi:hypothetical protein